MKKRSIIRSVVLFLFLCLSGSLVAHPTPTFPVCQSVIPKIQKRGILVVGVLNDQASENIPNIMKKKENIIMKELAERLKVKLKLDDSYRSFNDVIDAVANKRVDVGISYLSVTNARLTKVSFSVPYVSIKQDIVLTQQTWNKFKHTQSLLKMLNNNQTKLALLSGSSYEWLGEGLFPKAQYMSFANWEDIASALRKNKSDITLMDDVEYKIFFSKEANEKNNFVKFSLGGFFNDHIAVAIPKTSCDLTAFINQYLIRHHLAATKTLTDNEIDKLFGQFHKVI